MNSSLRAQKIDLLNPAIVPMILPAQNASTDNEVALMPEIVAPSVAMSRYCDVDTDNETATLWVRLKNDAPGKFTPELLKDLSELHRRIGSQLVRGHAKTVQPRLRYQVLASDIPGIFSLGGDLELFRQCITSGDSHTLSQYAQAAVSLIYATADAYNNELTTVALVQGQALGGGFEAALAAHVLIAERSAKMAFPEVLFNMFPGMGAYQLLSRRLSAREAEQLILSGRTYSALELHALGVVDVLAEDGAGEDAVRRYIRTHDRQHHARKGFRRALQASAPLELAALRRVAEIWVETAMGLAPRDLDTIDYLLRAQQRHRESTAATAQSSSTAQ